MQLFSSLVRINGNDQDALAGLAFFEFASGDFNKAIQIYNTMKSDYLNKPMVKVNYAYAQYMSGNKSKAQSLLSEINDSGDSDFNQYVNRVRRLVN